MLSLLMNIMLSPILVMQGCWVKWRAVKLPEAKGERSGIEGYGKPLSLLILGDSAAAGVGVSIQKQALSGQLVQQLSQNFHIKWMLIAKSGINSPMLIEHLSTVPALHFDVVITSIGVNDVTRTTQVKAWLKIQQQIRQEIIAKFSPSLIIVSAPPPMQHFKVLPNPLRTCLGHKVVQFNQALKNDIKQKGILYASLDFPIEDDLLAEDGFHPGAKMYSLWAQKLARNIEQQFLT
ncbi:MAG: lipase [Gammaproteobacteria bacterium CG22_combo_CG10-13_8_21_14_all_40_8]|nr:MAG: lipase [Gammaproteobacteria bacterium CG22_combo_CG10-13_8_21_14_all_40_8]